MDRGAVFDETGKYRYSLYRRWGDGGSIGTFIMLNPSTADAFKEDPTITRCIGFAQRFGHDAMNIVNLFALRSTDPKKLLEDDDPVGPANDEYIRGAVNDSATVICAWGAHKTVVGRDVEAWRAAISTVVPKVFCFGRTKAGHPKHPLYLRSDTKTERFRAVPLDPANVL